MQRQNRQLLSRIVSVCLVLMLFIFIRKRYFFITEYGSREQDTRYNLKADSKDVCDDDFRSNPASRYLFQNRTRIFFNRIPKTGSGITRILLDKIANKNNFRYAGASGRPDATGSGMNPGDDEIKRRVISHLESASEEEKIVIIGHIWFVNFTKYGHPQPIYINLVRDPIDRLVSWYNFIRFSHPRNMTEQKRMMTYDTCVTSHDLECLDSKNIAVMVPFFCGQEAYCSRPGIESLQKAKQNIMRYYSVVGYMDRLDEFFIALEFMLPHFFKDIADTYQSQKLKLLETRTQSNKTLASDSTRAIMKIRLPEEYELYYFIKQRFDCLIKKINLIDN